MAKQFRVLDQCMASLGDKEATYNAGPAAWTLGAAFQLFEFGESFVEWEDALLSDRDTVHGSQFATAQEILRQSVRMAYSEPKVRPAHLAGFAALAGGNLAASVQDGGLTAYRHKIIPVAATVQLPSIGVQEKASGEQYKYLGVKVDSLSLRRGGPSNAFWSLDVALIGSGTRATAADAFPAKVSVDPLRWQDSYCWLESGTDISIDATPTQGLENISSATPDNFTARLLDVQFEHRNDLQAEDGYAPGGDKVRSRLDHGPARGATLRLELIVDESTLAAERAYYTGQANCAVEIESKSGTLVAVGGAYTYGFDLIIPRLRLAPVGRGVRDGVNTLILAGECFDDGTNPLWILYVYNAQSTYLT